MHRGWYGKYRKSLDHPLFKKPLIWHYWDYCLLKANHKQKEIWWNRKLIKIERGCFITGRKQAAMDTGLTEHNVRVAQDTLINLGMIERIKDKSTSHFSYISVCNFIKYQEQIKKSHQQSTSSPPAVHQQSTTTKNVKKDKNEKKNLKPLCEEIFNFWNSLEGPVTHKSIKEFESCIRARLEIYSKEEIMESMSNYAKILTDPNCKWNYKYPLKAFLERKVNNIDRFATANDPFTSFQKKPADDFEPNQFIDYDDE